MASVIPVRLAHAWAIVWLDFYQTPAIIADSVTSSVKDFFGELTRSGDQYPHNASKYINNICLYFLSESSNCENQ